MRPLASSRASLALLVAVVAVLAVVVTGAAGCSSGGPCCTIPVSLNVPCGLCGSNNAQPTAEASHAEAPPPIADADAAAVRRRAAFELECAAEKLELVVLDSKTRGVTGCGKRATYVKQCASDTAPCDWIPKPAS